MDRILVLDKNTHNHWRFHPHLLVYSSTKTHIAGVAEMVRIPMTLGISERISHPGNSCASSKFTVNDPPVYI